MNLNEPTQENLKYILNELADRLDIANRILVNDEDYDLNRYDELKYMYDVVVRKNQLSVSEKYAFIDELRSVRIYHIIKSCIILLIHHFIIYSNDLIYFIIINLSSMLLSYICSNTYTFYIYISFN